MTSADDLVLDLALKKGLLSAADLAAARAQVKEPTRPEGSPTTVLETLLVANTLERRVPARLLAEAFGMPLVDLQTATVSSEALDILDGTLARRYTVMPLTRGPGVLRVALGDPLDVDAIDSLAHVVKLEIEGSIAPVDEIRQAIDRYYGREGRGSSESFDTILETASASRVLSTVAMSATTQEVAAESDAPIVRLVHQIIQGALQRRASDIHLEPLEKRFRVRYRIDGVLLEVEGPPKRLQLAIISRVKIMANISIAEKRMPQDGRIQVDLGQKTIDLRVSSLPTAHGESIVMRLLDKEGLQLGLPELGFFSDDQYDIERLIASPDGMLLVTGPTGSGKTTTLYSCLHVINQPDRKIITVEDPVEYQLTGVNQVPVRHDVGMTFASALRAMLRQAPDIVMVGEIRDLETAEIAINASLTGHLVFSTLHTNDAPGAVNRLIDIGVKPFLVSTALRAVVAQRLVRKLCRECGQPVQPDARELRSIGILPSQAVGGNFRRGSGCPQCQATGYRGRVGIFETFVVNDELRHLIYDRAGTGVLRKKARALGMRTLREDGVRKAISGQTTIEEIASVTVDDQS